MKIGPLDTKSLTPAAVERKPTAGATPVSADAASAKVALSPAASLGAASEVDSASFDQAKVERISQAIRDGKFVIDAEAIADKLIVNAQELLGTRPRS